MKIAIAGTGYVGLSNAMIFAQHHQVVAYDLQAEKIKLLNQRISPIRDQEISDFLAKPELNFQATHCKVDAYQHADFVIIAPPTDYDPETNYFNTKSVAMGCGDYGLGRTGSRSKYPSYLFHRDGRGILPG